MSFLKVLIFAIFAVNSLGQRPSFLPPLYISPGAPPIDFEDILASAAAPSERLQELAESFRDLGSNNAGFPAFSAIDLSNPDTLPFPIDPPTPGLPPPALGGAAQEVLNSLFGADSEEEVVANLPQEFQGFQAQFSRFGNRFGSKKGSFETDEKETSLQVNILNDILSQD